MAPSLQERPAGLVLVVERSDDLRDFFSMVLASAGCDVLQAADCPSALALLESERPGLLLVEAEQPALELLDRIESLEPPPAVVVMLASQPMPGWPDRLRGRAAAVLIKPFGVRQLLEVCGQALETGLPLPERRRTPRQPLAAAVEVYGAGGRPVRGDILDLSRSGARLRLSQPLESGTLHHFTLSPERLPVARATGAVAWQAWQEDCWLLGVEFAPLPGRSCEGVERLLAEPGD